MPGHLFITRGDLLELACDALLVPSGRWGDRLGHVGHAGWHGALQGVLDHASFATPAPSEERRVVDTGTTHHGTRVWIGHTGESHREPEWYAEAVGRFVVEASVPSLAFRPLGDSRPLLGVPLVGTGAGGAADRKGEVVRAMVRATAAAQRGADADLVFVTADDDQYAAMQHARRVELGDGAWQLVTSTALEVADRLADRARSGRLVVFAGAGASAGAGAPSWPELIASLAHHAGLGAHTEELTEEMDARDAAAVLAHQLGVDCLRRLVVELTDCGPVSLVHQLIASLPVDEAVTTNYDTCLERAMRSAGRPPKVLPGETIDDDRRWLLKLHGTVEAPDSIVLSRDDYLDFEGTRGALSGVVQALLLTRHMLFVGYSLRDDNFHRLVHQVRRTLAMSSTAREPTPFATALTPASTGLLQKVWERDIRYVSTHHEAGDGQRRLAVLLDLVGSLSATPGRQLLDDSYAAMFDAPDLAVRDAIRELDALLARPGVSDAVFRAFTRREP